MTQLILPSANIANSNKFTFVRWFRGSDFAASYGGGDYLTGAFDLFAWGDPSLYANYQWYSTISLRNNGAGIQVFLQSTPGNLGGNPFSITLSMSASSHQGPSGAAHSYANLDAFYDYALVTFAPTYPHTNLITTDDWHVLFCSWDISQNDGFVWGIGEQQVFTVNKRREIYLDGVDVLHGLGDATVNPGFPTFVQNSMGSGISYGDPAPPNGTPGTAPGFPIAMSGMPFYVPTLPDFTNPPYDMISAAPAMECGCTQFWSGLFVEPNAGNFSKFWREENGKLYPVGGRIAADFFGVPDIWLERDNVSGVKYEENQGTAGEFQVVGTKPTDFNPDPTDDPPIGP